MKRLFFIIIILSIFGINYGQVSFSEGGDAPDPSAALDINYSNKGLLIPRVPLTSNTDVVTIPSPAISLLVYNTGTGGLTPAGYYYWNGSQWVMIGSNHTHQTITFDDSGAGAPSGSSYDGSASLTVSYNTIGAAPANHTHSGMVTGNGIANYNAYWTSSNTLGAEQYVSVSRGGTGLGLIPSNGQLLIGNGSGYTLSTLTAGTGITITNGPGSITISATGSSNAWLTTGNSGLSDGTHFLGTTDNVPLNFKVNNNRAGRIDNSTYNTFLGYLSGGTSTTGNKNVGIGYQALSSLTSGSQNVAVGYQALMSLTTPLANTAVGYYALRDNQTSGSNTALGYYSLAYHTSGSYNTAVGDYAMTNVNTGQENVAVGSSALMDANNGDYNTAIGVCALQKTSGDYNTGIGYYAGYYVGKTQFLTGHENVLIGYQAGKDIVDGHYNTVIGARANVAPGVFGATAIGYKAYADQGWSVILGCVGGVNGATQSANVGIGTTRPATALHVVRSITNTTTEVTVRISPPGGGSYSTSRPSIFDMWATFDNFPSDQGARRTASIVAKFIGGTWGHEALSFHVGYGGSANDDANLPYERVRIHTSGQNYVWGGWYDPSDKRIKSDITEINYGLNEIMKIKPVKYLLHDPKGFEYIPEKLSKNGKPDIGIIAQDLYNIIPEAVYKPKNEIELCGINYDKLIPVIIKAIQEQQQLIEILQNQINELNKKIEEKNK